MDYGMKTTILTYACLALVVTGCATARINRDGPHPAWPSPTATPRVVHLFNLHDASDLGGGDLGDAIGRWITGSRTQAMLRPHAAVVDDREQLYVTDQELQGVHVFDLATGKARFINKVGQTYLVSPVDVAVCGGVVAVSDSALRKVYLLDRQDQLVHTLDKPEGFGRPTGLAYDPDFGELYVVDTLARQVCVFDMKGQLLRTFGSAGGEPGQFNFPTHIAVRNGLVYVTDSLNFRVQAFSRDGQYRFDVGKHGDASGHLGVPKGVAVDSQGHIYVVDSYFSTIQVFDKDGNFLLNFGQTGCEPGQFQLPMSLSIDLKDRLFVCDSFNKRVQVFQFTGASHDEK